MLRSLELLKTPVSTRCDHRFCRYCILETIGTRPSVPCPLCKEPFTKRSLTSLTKWKQIVTAVHGLLDAFERDTGAQFTPPKGPPIPLSQPCTQGGKKSLTVTEDISAGSRGKRKSSGSAQTKAEKPASHSNVRQTKKRRLSDESSPFNLQESEDNNQEVLPGPSKTQENVSSAFPASHGKPERCAKSLTTPGNDQKLGLLDGKSERTNDLVRYLQEDVLSSDTGKALDNTSPINESTNDNGDLNGTCSVSAVQNGTSLGFVRSRLSTVGEFGDNCVSIQIGGLQVDQSSSNGSEDDRQKVFLNTSPVVVIEDMAANINAAKVKKQRSKSDVQGIVAGKDSGMKGEMLADTEIDMFSVSGDSSESGLVVRRIDSMHSIPSPKQVSSCNASIHSEDDFDVMLFQSQAHPIITPKKKAQPQVNVNKTKEVEEQDTQLNCSWLEENQVCRESTAKSRHSSQSPVTFQHNAWQRITYQKAKLFKDGPMQREFQGPELFDRVHSWLAGISKGERALEAASSVVADPSTWAGPQELSPTLGGFSDGATEHGGEVPRQKLRKLDKMEHQAAVDEENTRCFDKGPQKTCIQGPESETGVGALTTQVDSLGNVQGKSWALQRKAGRIRILRARAMGDAQENTQINANKSQGSNDTYAFQASQHTPKGKGRKKGRGCKKQNKKGRKKKILDVVKGKVEDPEMDEVVLLETMSQNGLAETDKRSCLKKNDAMQDKASCGTVEFPVFSKESSGKRKSKSKVQKQVGETQCNNAEMEKLMAKIEAAEDFELQTLSQWQHTEAEAGASGDLVEGEINVKRDGDEQGGGEVDLEILACEQPNHSEELNHGDKAHGQVEFHTQPAQDTVVQETPLDSEKETKRNQSAKRNNRSDMQFVTKMVISKNGDMDLGTKDAVTDKAKLEVTYTSAPDISNVVTLPKRKTRLRAKGNMSGSAVGKIEYDPKPRHPRANSWQRLVAWKQISELEKVDWSAAKSMTKDFMPKTKKLKLVGSGEEGGINAARPKQQEAGQRPTVSDEDVLVINDESTQDKAIEVSEGEDTDSMELELSPSKYEQPNLEIQPEEVKSMLSESSKGTLERNLGHEELTVIAESTIETEHQSIRASEEQQMEAGYHECRSGLQTDRVNQMSKNWAPQNGKKELWKGERNRPDRNETNRRTVALDIENLEVSNVEKYTEDACNLKQTSRQIQDFVEETGKNAKRNNKIVQDQQRKDAALLPQKQRESDSASQDKEKKTASLSQDKQRPAGSPSEDKQREAESPSQDKRRKTDSSSQDKKAKAQSPSQDQKKVVDMSVALVENSENNESFKISVTGESALCVEDHTAMKKGVPNYDNCKEKLEDKAVACKKKNQTTFALHGSPIRVADDSNTIVDSEMMVVESVSRQSSPNCQKPWKSQRHKGINFPQKTVQDNKEEDITKMEVEQQNIFRKNPQYLGKPAVTSPDEIVFATTGASDSDAVPCIVRVPLHHELETVDVSLQSSPRIEDGLSKHSLYLEKGGQEVIGSRTPSQKSMPLFGKSDNSTPNSDGLVSRRTLSLRRRRSPQASANGLSTVDPNATLMLEGSPGVWNSLVSSLGSRCGLDAGESARFVCGIVDKGSKLIAGESNGKDPSSRKVCKTDASVEGQSSIEWTQKKEKQRKDPKNQQINAEESEPGMQSGDTSPEGSASLSLLNPLAPQEATTELNLETAQEPELADHSKDEVQKEDRSKEYIHSSGTPKQTNSSKEKVIELSSDSTSSGSDDECLARMQGKVKKVRGIRGVTPRVRRLVQTKLLPKPGASPVVALTRKSLKCQDEGSPEGRRNVSPKIKISPKMTCNESAKPLVTDNKTTNRRELITKDPNGGQFCSSRVEEPEYCEDILPSPQSLEHIGKNICEVQEESSEEDEYIAPTPPVRPNVGQRKPMKMNLKSLPLQLLSVEQEEEKQVADNDVKFKVPLEPGESLKQFKRASLKCLEEVNGHVSQDSEQSESILKKTYKEKEMAQKRPAVPSVSSYDLLPELEITAKPAVLQNKDSDKFPGDGEISLVKKTQVSNKGREKCQGDSQSSLAKNNKVSHKHEEKCQKEHSKLKTDFRWPEEKDLPLKPALKHSAKGANVLEEEESRDVNSPTEMAKVLANIQQDMSRSREYGVEEGDDVWETDELTEVDRQMDVDEYDSNEELHTVKRARRGPVVSDDEEEELQEETVKNEEDRESVDGHSEASTYSGATHLTSPGALSSQSELTIGSTAKENLEDDIDKIQKEIAFWEAQVNNGHSQEGVNEEDCCDGNVGAEVDEVTLQDATVTSSQVEKKVNRISASLPNQSLSSQPIAIPESGDQSMPEEVPCDADADQEIDFCASPLEPTPPPDLPHIPLQDPELPADLRRTSALLEQFRSKSKSYRSPKVSVLLESPSPHRAVVTSSDDRIQKRLVVHDCQLGIKSERKERSSYDKEKKSLDFTQGFPQRSDWNFVVTQIKGNAKTQIEKFAALLGASFSGRFNPMTTHVIVKPVEAGRLVCQRTLKYFQGIAKGCWVVSVEWVQACLARGCLLSEELYEIEGDDINGKCHGGPKKSRLANQGLLRYYEICCYGNFADMSKEELKIMVEMCGATIVQHPSTFPFDRRKEQIVLLEENGTVSQAEKRLLRQCGGTVVVREWLLDTIAQHCIMPLSEEYHFF